MNSAWGTDGDIAWYLQQQDGGGWDIVSLEVKGKSVLEPKKGEFSSREEAKKAALEKARQFAKANGVELR